MAGLTELQFYRPTSELTAHAEVLAAHVRAHPCATLAEACAAIEALTGLLTLRFQSFKTSVSGLV